MGRYDRIIKKALFDAAAIEIRQIELSPKIEFPDRSVHEKRTAEIIKCGLRSERKAISELKRKRIILVAAIILSLIFTVTACAVIEPIRNFIVSVAKEATSFSPSDDSSPPEVEYFGKLHYLPGGFVLNESESIYGKNLCQEVYYNKEQRIEYKQLAIHSSDSSFDSEGSPFEIINIGGKEIYLFTKWKNDVAVWHDDIYRYSISYPEEIGTSELQLIVEGIKISE